ncbi:acyl-CoA thioesterase [Calothrix sp. PCC 6303]|uniref:acyl-CoA thioesterase n=1 Tax=Calothrix sp. PCC 6303 TaxID=1170562 RepID=UPI0002A0194C|nr:thioesterase family protein [Calothrix sp. PCC 6303]AFY99821.1 4-hydroxybenzoyl-CoA thioesterase [Calothrix sp. PCC 6303]
MSEKKVKQPQLSPTGSITNPSKTESFADWLEYPIRVYPHHTDHGGIVWHGAYLAWMEEGRIECLRSVGVDYGDIVALGCELPVVELSLRYHQSLKLGMSGVLKTRISEVTGVRINCEQVITSVDQQKLYLSAKVTLVAVDRDRGKIMRQLPATFKDALSKLKV